MVQKKTFAGKYSAVMTPSGWRLVEEALQSSPTFAYGEEARIAELNAMAQQARAAALLAEINDTRCVSMIVRTVHAALDTTYSIRAAA